MSAESSAITRILLEAKDATEAAPQLLPLVYDELRRIAARQLGKSGGGHLQTTELVHEAYLRLFDASQLQWHHRQHFFGAAALAMRHILVDHARRRQARKRTPPDALDAVMLPLTSEEGTVDLLALNDALDGLTELSPRQAKIVELRYFGGFTEPEVAEILDISESLVAKDWRVARLWLRARMRA